MADMKITKHKDGSASMKCNKCGGEFTASDIEEAKRKGTEHLDWHRAGAPMKVV